ncbi:MAG: hypothetical protein ACRCTY_10400, partial [Candidatus Adiutrix sp.]
MRLEIITIYSPKLIYTHIFSLYVLKVTIQGGVRSFDTKGAPYLLNYLNQKTKCLITTPPFGHLAGGGNLRGFACQPTTRCPFLKPLPPGEVPGFPAERALRFSSLFILVSGKR